MTFIQLSVDFIKKIILFGKDFLVIPITKVQSNSSASLTLIGVGPGDPELLTIAAIRAIKESTLVAYPVADLGSRSMALEIVSFWIKRKRKLPLLFPMVTDSNVLRDSWRKACDKLIEAVRKGEKVVFISQGDSSLYSTSAYVLLYIKSIYKEFSLKVIPGINSFSAAAALGQCPLALQKETLVISPVLDEMTLEKLLDESIDSERVLVLLKLGSKWLWVRPILERRGLLENSLFAKKVGFSDEEIKLSTEVPADIKPYFSMLIIRKNWPSLDH